MSSVFTAMGILGGLCLAFGLLLAVAYRYLKVYEDPRIDTVEELLPGSNCGACAEPGCRAFAERLVAGDREPSGCTVSGSDAIDEVAQLLGVDAGEAVKRVARLACAGGAAQATELARYEGQQTCATAAVVAGGGKGCSWGCLGLADCQVSCSFDAIVMNADLLPVVDVDKCTACGDCVTACPRNLFHIRPLEHALLVQCSAPLTGELARSMCSVACDGCEKCVLDAPPSRISMVCGLPGGDLAGDPVPASAARRCPTSAICWVPGAQFQPEQENTDG